MGCLEQNPNPYSPKEFTDPNSTGYQNQTLEKPIHNYTTLTFFEEDLNYEENITWHSNKFAAIYAFEKPITFVYEEGYAVLPWRISIKTTDWIYSCNPINMSLSSNINYAMNYSTHSSFQPLGDSCGVVFYPGEYNVVIDNKHIGKVMVKG